MSGEDLLRCRAVQLRHLIISTTQLSAEVTTVTVQENGLKYGSFSTCLRHPAREKIIQMKATKAVFLIQFNCQ